MAGSSHPFFGNQYTDGDYIIGSFKFPNGLSREVGKRLSKVAMPADTGAIPSINNVVSLKSSIKTRTPTKWIVPAIVVAAIAAAGGYFAYKYFKKKGIIKIPNVGVCEYCGEPLAGADLVTDDDNPYIICKKCGEKNYAHYPAETAPESKFEDKNDNQ